MATSSVGRTTINGSTTVGGFNPLSLFAAGEQGVWYDPSDLSTMYQDSAGTIPVTAVEQPVGRILDKSGRGNHATQATLGNRPVLSARVNIATYTDDLAASAWTPYGSSRSSETGPTGVAGGAVKITASAGGTYHQIQSATISSTTPNANYTLSVYAKAGTSNYACVDLYSTTQQFVSAVFNLSNTYATSASETKLGTTSGTLVSTSQAYIGNGWFRLSVVGSFNRPDITPLFCIANAATGNTFDQYGEPTFSAAGTESIILSGVDLRITNFGVNLPPYQRVGAATYGTSLAAGNPDYNTNGFPFYLNFDGTNDYLQVASFTMPLVQRMTAVSFAETSAVANAGLVSVYPATGNDYDSTTGYVFCPSNRTTARFIVVGSTPSAYEVLWTTTPSAIIPSSVMVEDKQTSAGYLRVNGVQVGSDTSFTQFSANSNGGLLLGVRWISSAIASPYLNGRMYGVILRGAATTANQITGTENWLNQKTMAY